VVRLSRIRSHWIGGRALLLGACLLLTAGAVEISRAADTRPSASSSVKARQESAARRAARKRRDPRLFIPRVSPAAVPRVQVMIDPPQASAGARVVVTIRLTDGRGPARHASFHLGVDPSLMRYAAFHPTGRGALVVEESGTPGEIVVYRSSLPEGFASVEPLLEVEYDVLAPGSSSVFLTDVRLIDGLARDLSVTHESTTLDIE
jgi:hypothetical protein